jgi:DNA-binding CsgD family transcriptional regulator
MYASPRSMRAAYEVSSREVWAIIRMFERAALPVEPLFDGLTFGRGELRERSRVGWDDFVVFSDNALGVAGDPETLADIFESSYHEVMPELRLLARAFVDPITFTRFVLETLNPLAWTSCVWNCENLGGSDLRVTCRLHPGARPNVVFFQACVGALRGAPRHLGLPPARILSSQIAQRRATYDVRMPVSQTLVARGQRLSHALLGRVTAHLVFGYEEVDGGVDPFELLLEDRTMKWGLAHRQAEVLRLVAKGMANKEIASSLGCSVNTVELHMTRVLKKAGASSRSQLIAAFWRSDSDSP